jgi:hypothetical protein
MNSIRPVINSVAVVAVGLGTAGVLAASDSASAGTAPAGSGSFTVTTHQSSESDIDLGATGFSAGDEQFFTGALTRHGTHVGRLVGSCTTAHVGKTADQLCEFVLSFGASQINASGSVSSGEQGPGTFALPILGGTGRYRGAAGQITVTATTGKTLPITVSLR